MLTGEIKSYNDIPENSTLKHFPRFSPENFPKNLELVKSIEDIAQSKGVTPAQLAIAWVRYLSAVEGNPVIMPIPGATKESRIIENAKEVTLEEEDIKKIDLILSSFEAVGGRYGGPGAQFMDG